MNPSLSSSGKKKSKTKNVEELLPDYFIDLDRNFIGLKKPEDETFLYKSSDVLVQANWELPVRLKSIVLTVCIPPLPCSVLL
jgi:hypothetical protein